jgi:hypothetical protein
MLWLPTKIISMHWNTFALKKIKTGLLKSVSGTGKKKFRSHEQGGTDWKS